MPRNTITSPIILRELILLIAYPSSGLAGQRPGGGGTGQRNQRAERPALLWLCFVFKSDSRLYFYPCKTKTDLSVLWPPHQDPEWKCSWVQMACFFIPHSRWWPLLTGSPPACIRAVIGESANTQQGSFPVLAPRPRPPWT